MAAQTNFFELLGDEETDASAVIERAVAMEKVKKKQQEETQPLEPQDPPKLPSKPLPPAQAVRESKASQPVSRRGRGGQGREQGGYGNREQGSYGNREQGGYGNRDRDYNGSFNRPFQEGGFQRNRSFDRSDGYRREGNGFESSRGRFYGQGRPAPSPAEEGEGGQNVEGGRGPGRFYGGGRRQGRAYGGSADSQGAGGGAERQQQRAYVRKDAAGAVQEPKEDKPEGGDVIVAEVEKESVADKQPVEEPKVDAGAVEEKKEEEEDKEMLLDDYYTLLNEKNKHLKSQKADERKVVLDKDLAKMVIVEKKQDEGDFVKLGLEKDKGKRKEVLISKDEKPRKNVSINEFLKPAIGEEYYTPASRRGRGRGGRGRGSNEGFRGGIGGSYNMGRQGLAPRIEDPSQFPTLGGAK